jgi:hypothetical protein
MSYFLNIATSCSQFISTLFGGHPDFTISSRTYLAAARGSDRALVWVRVLDTIFWFDEDHCRGSWLKDVKNSEFVRDAQKSIMLGKHPRRPYTWRQRFTDVGIVFIVIGLIWWVL